MSRRLRIAMVAACPFPWPRGTPVRIHRMAEALAVRGHEVHLVTYHHGGRLLDPPFHVHRIRPVRFYRDVEPGPRYTKLLVLDPMLWWRLRGLMREMRFDVIHAHHYEGLLVSAAAPGRVPVVYDAHTTLASELPSYGLGLPAGLKRGLGRFLDRTLPGRARHVVAVTDEIRRVLIDCGVADADITVVPNGVEIESFPVSEPAASGRSPTVLYAGTLADYQRVDLLLDAFALVRASRPGVRLIIATGSPFSQLESQVDRLGINDAIELVAAAFDALPALLARADMAVSTRVVCAGIPQKILNYMAGARPVIAFRGSGALVEHDVTGIVVPDGDVRAFADAIVALIDDPVRARRLGAAGRDRVATGFTWGRTAERIEDVYDRILGAVYEARAREPSRVRSGG